MSKFAQVRRFKPPRLFLLAGFLLMPLIILLATGPFLSLLATADVIIPEHLLLKTDKENIIAYTKTIYCGEMNGWGLACVEDAERPGIKYAYKGNQLTDAPGEIVAQRTNKARFFQTQSPNAFKAEIFGGDPQFYKDENDVWWQVEYGLTTRQAFYIQYFSRGFIAAIVSKAIAAQEEFFSGAPVIDGFISRYFEEFEEVTWEELLASSANYVFESEVEFSTVAAILSGSNYDKWQGLARGFYIFDTTGVPQDATILSATTSIWVSNMMEFGDQSLVIVSSSPASVESLDEGDFHAIGSISLSDFVPTLASIVNQQQLYYPLNALGIANIIKGGDSKFGFRMSSDISGIAPAPWDDNQFVKVEAHGAEWQGLETDPRLEITYEVAE